ncbi:anti-repressor SinI family protein [Domibacillus epiphyticus]|nr:anti-repressor SinI family protein [Domibacillus epiphyticus]
MLGRNEVKFGKLDKEWIELIQIARDMDIPIEVIRAFLFSTESNPME